MSGTPFASCVRLRSAARPREKDARRRAGERRARPGWVARGDVGPYRGDGVHSIAAHPVRPEEVAGGRDRVRGERRRGEPGPRRGPVEGTEERLAPPGGGDRGREREDRDRRAGGPEPLGEPGRGETYGKEEGEGAGKEGSRAPAAGGGGAARRSAPRAPARPPARPAAPTA